MRAIAAVLVVALLAGCTTGGPGPSPPTGQDFAENFDPLERMPDGWKEHGGKWELRDDAGAPSQPHLVQGQPAQGTAVFLAEGKGTFGTVNLSVTLLPQTTGRYGILIHGIGEQTHHALEIEALQDAAAMRLVEMFEGKATTLAEGAVTTPLWKLRVSLSFSAGGLSARAGPDAISATAPRLSVGSIGLWVADGRVGFDDVFVDRLSS